MATTEQVINAALKKIIVQGAESPLEPDEYQDAIMSLNMLMSDWEANGITLGYTLVSNLSDPVTIPTGALRGTIYNLAVECAPEYDGIVTPECARIAAESMNTIRQIGQSIPTSFYPSTLPLGSRNYNLQWGLTTFFYPDREGEILAETTGSIGLEVLTGGSDAQE